jgi:translation initiation factor 5B
MSAQAKAILLHKQKIAEEEERLKKLREEEEERIRIEEEREAAERKRIQEEKDRKKKAKQEKVDAQKAAGTYKTKAEKERLRKAQERLDALKAAGHLVIPDQPANKEESAAPEKGGALLYGARRKPQQKKPITGQEAQQQQQQQQKEEEESSEESESEDEEDEEEQKTVSVASPTKAVAPAVAAAPAPAPEEELLDDWDADDNDWEKNLEKITLKIETRKEESAKDVEDLIELERKQEQEKLRQQGLERQRRDEELRIKREEEDRAREEMERREREAYMKKEHAKKARIEREQAARNARSKNNLRSPIACIMGHVDTGKTKLLDKIRHTNVQEGEAGGITQQIGATQFPRETLMVQTQCMQEIKPFEINIPGLLVIDTPGHESFTNLRSRGSSLCDIAILVIDLMHGLEQQTIESINLLKKRRCPFIVALNKVDRCYGWKTLKDGPIQKALAQQDENCGYEFKDRSERIIVQLMELGMNAKLYWENDDPAHTVSLVPTSAITGEGIPDLLKMIITLTQERLTDQLMYMENLQCTVLEVKVIEGLGHTVDVVLVNGTLREGDSIVVSTMDGPVVTNIRALLTPPPNREMRVRSEYIHHEMIKGAIGVKIVAPDIARAVAGTPIMVLHPDDDVEDIKEEVQSDLTKVMKSLQTDQKGVMVHASTLGALEALLQFLREECKPSIPVSFVNIGPIHKKDVMRASIMHEKKMPEYATILAFDVPIDSEARAMAEESNVKIFTAEIIYHLFDQFTAYMNGLYETKKNEAQAVVVFPCVLKILPQHIFNKKDPIVIGVEVVEGTLRINTPLYIPALELDVGVVNRLEINHKEVTAAKKGSQVSIRITNESNPTLTYGRQFDHTQTLYSKISRASIDACKEFFKE